MIGEDRKTSGIDQMQPVLVDSEGQIWSVTSRFFWVRPPQPDGNIVDYAVSNLGFIHIWPVDGFSVVVALRPDRVHPKAMAAAFYAIADLRPVRVFIAATNTTRQRWELFRSIDRALNRIEQLVTAARNSAIGTQLLRIWELSGEAIGQVAGCCRSAAFPRSCLGVRRSDCRRRVEAGPATRWQGSHVDKRLCRTFLDSPCRDFLPKLRGAMGLARRADAMTPRGLVKCPAGLAEMARG